MTPEQNMPKNENSENIPWTEKRGGAIFLIILAIVLSSIAQIFITEYQTSQTQKAEKINLAKGYLIDVNNVDDTINSYLIQYNNVNSPDYHKGQIFIKPLYPSWGLYHSNKQDITKFPRQLSNDTYYFYNQILTAENAREEYNNYDTLHPLNNNSPIDQQIQNREEVRKNLFFGYWGIIDDLHQYTIPNLKKELNDLIASS